MGEFTDQIETLNSEDGVLAFYCKGRIDKKVFAQSCLDHEHAAERIKREADDDPAKPEYNAAFIESGTEHMFMRELSEKEADEMGIDTEEFSKYFDFCPADMEGAFAITGFCFDVS